MTKNLPLQQISKNEAEEQKKKENGRNGKFNVHFSQLIKQQQRSFINSGHKNIFGYKEQSKNRIAENKNIIPIPRNGM